MKREPEDDTESLKDELYEEGYDEGFEDGYQAALEDCDCESEDEE